LGGADAESAASLTGWASEPTEQAETTSTATGPATRRAP
jgi:hypothetical protein